MNSLERLNAIDRSPANLACSGLYNWRGIRGERPSRGKSTQKRARHQRAAADQRTPQQSSAVYRGIEKIPGRVDYSLVHDISPLGCCALREGAYGRRRKT